MRNRQIQIGVDIRENKLYLTAVISKGMDGIGINVKIDPQPYIVPYQVQIEVNHGNEKRFESEVIEWMIGKPISIVVTDHSGFKLTEGLLYLQPYGLTIPLDFNF